MDMKTRKPKISKSPKISHISEMKGPLFKKMPDLETGISRMARANRMERDMKKVNQIADGIRVAEMISRHDK
tara:strand:+ start:280 stop:495 length:216 start_codon:yes stop_codon:yes gene_type:complete